VRGAAPGFGDHLARHEQPELDAHARESDSLPACLSARGNVVIPRQLPSLHAAPIVHDRERRVSWVGEKADPRRAGVERVRHGFGENCLLKGAGVRVPQIFEQVLEVDSGLAHAYMLSPAAALSSTRARANVESFNQFTLQVSVAKECDRCGFAYFPRWCVGACARDQGVVSDVSSMRVAPVFRLPVRRLRR
jgi:hypothetical protein